MLGLVLTAGGARGAYQVGVLKRIGEISRLKGKPSPFAIVTGASAGAINGAAIAAGSSDFSHSTERLTKLWSSLQISDVFRTDAMSLGAGSLKWIRDLTFGGVIGGGRAQSLLDFSPLRSYLEQHLPLAGVATAIEKGDLYALALSATDYYSGKSFTFIEGKAGHPTWQKSRRTSLSVSMKIDHIWGSCAIPVVFQPVKIETTLGSFYFGDGGLRLTAPCSPAIRLGADRVFAIGIRSQRSAESRIKSELLEEGKTRQMKKPPMAQVVGVVLNSIFLDHLDTDLEHLKRMNAVVDAYSESAAAAEAVAARLSEPIRRIEALSINPSVDLSEVAERHAARMPRVLSYFMEGLGSSKVQSADLLSYLLFDGAYLRELIDIGYADAQAQHLEIESFLGI